MTNVPVPMNDLTRIPLDVKGRILDACTQVLSRGRYILSDECLRFERRFAEYCSSQHCISVASGTDALEIAIRSLDITSGSSIAMVANAGGYAAIAAERAGYRSVFVDVDRSTKLIDPSHLRQTLSSYNIAAVIVTHLYGSMCDMTQIAQMVAETGVPLIEDCAQAHGAKHRGRMAGSYGHVSCFSFYPTKNLGGIGDSGAVITQSKDLAEKIEILRQYGWSEKYKIDHAGGRNSRMDELQAAALMINIEELAKGNMRRQAIAKIYSDNIRHPLVTTPTSCDNGDVVHLYVILSEDRASLRKHLANNGIASEIHYPIPDYRQNGLMNRNHQTLENTEFLSSRVLSIPCFPQLSDDEIWHVVSTINAWR